ncbi:cell envelope-related function transcriptional attenuator common domain-containing protein [Evansella caseinilytica]|uniref:Regulatory protein MsrR n=1 Tax=Evansella caseinilytica TaxID=1503961 RepID=A0A1H3PKY9_9BACI|nr:LCP family protein [Evansella caseinilytica]SDZ01119.1 cell envelope-related function transcriptional attenuator common domain-containing protein [Evansella caseinilytica]
MKRKRKAAKKTRKAVLILLFLFLLGGAAAASWMKNDYDRAREESLRQIEESGGSLENAGDIEFNSPVDDLDYINVLLVGLDREDGSSRTDTIMLAQYRPNEDKARLVSLMRDAYVSIPGYRDNKLNTAYFLGGLELLRQTLKENFDIDVHYYAQVDFDGFVRVVDTLAPSGVEVDVEKRMYYDGGGSLVIDFQPGPQIMDGEDALKYVRFRNDYENDFGRVRRQQEMLSILKNELLSLSGVRRIPQVLGSIEPYIQTNISTQKLLSYGSDFFLSGIDEIETLTIPVDGSYVDATYPHAGAVLELDLEENKQALHDFLEIDSPSSLTSHGSE